MTDNTTRKLRLRRKPAKAETVLSELRQAILEGGVLPGQRVRQEELAERFGVSRIPIREALLTLQREGLIESVGGRGVVVASLDPALIHNVYEVRMALDDYSAVALASRDDFDPAPLRRIIADARAACEQDDARALIRLDYLFHMGLYEALGNQVIIDVMGAQWIHITRALSATLRVSAVAKFAFWDGHAAILDSIVAHDHERARVTAVEHIKLARTVLLGDLSAAHLHSEQNKKGRRSSH